MTRPMILAQSGWYPSGNDACRKEIEDFIDEDVFLEGRTPVSCIVPHAGWFFCGHLSVNCIKLLKEKNGDINNVVIFGGHLGESNLAILETFDFAETPFGRLSNNRDLIELLKNDERVQLVDYLRDNTIEIVLPIVNYFFGSKVRITAIYLPPSIKTAELLGKIHDALGASSVFIGSTDLTHFGPNYGFTSHDNSMPPVEWVKNVNDKKYVDLLLAMKGSESVDYALKNRAACSAGAAFGALTLAKLSGVNDGLLVGYSTSYDRHRDTSFVGYAGIMY